MILLKKIRNWFKKYYQKIAVGFIGLLIAICFFLANQLKNKDLEIARVLNNSKYYEALATDSEESNRVLNLKINEYRTSEDSLIAEIRNVQKELKVKDQNLKQVQVINTVIVDTLEVSLPTPREIDFNLEFKPNSLTTIIVNRKDSILTTILDIKNEQVLFVETKKEYRNKYKNGWVRFWRFDFKKDKLNKFQIHNSNDLIEVTDTRIIEIAK